MAIMVSNTENPLPLVVIKDSFKIYFHEMEKLLPVERTFEELEQNQFPLARIKDLFQKYISNA